MNGVQPSENFGFGIASIEALYSHFVSSVLIQPGLKVSSVDPFLTTEEIFDLGFDIHFVGQAEADRLWSMTAKGFFDGIGVKVILDFPFLRNESNRSIASRIYLRGRVDIFRYIAIVNVNLG